MRGALRVTTTEAPSSPAGALPAVRGRARRFPAGLSGRAAGASGEGPAVHRRAACRRRTHGAGLDTPVLLGRDQVVEMLRMLDVPAIEQVIAVPKISLDGVPQRSVLRRPQKAEQLVDVPTDPVYSRAVIAWGRRVAAAMAEQTVDYPVPQGRRGWRRSSRFSCRAEFNSSGRGADR